MGKFFVIKYKHVRSYSLSLSHQLDHTVFENRHWEKADNCARASCEFANESTYNGTNALLVFHWA